MIDFFSSEEEDLFDLGEVSGKVDKEVDNPFKPWHKPRKQFIRENQWFNPLEQIVKSNKYNTIDTINYFGLPGGDLLDVTYISNKLLESNDLNNKLFQIHGFINSEQEHKKAQSRLSQLLDYKNVSDKSKVERFEFEELSREKSEAWKRIRGVGHYHLINLDFCDNVLNERTLPAIYMLLDYQAKRVHGTPWLLCITTRLNKSGMTPLILDKFDDVLKEIKTNPDLVTMIQSTFSDSLLTVEKLNSLDENQSVLLNELLQVCLIFWLINETIAKGCSIKLKSSYKYSVDLFNRKRDMHSYVFCLEKEDIISGDTLGLVSQNIEEPLTEEKINQIKIKAMERLDVSLDLDQHLEDHKEILNEFSEKMMDLLGKCGYDTSKYRQIMKEKFGYVYEE